MFDSEACPTTRVGAVVVAAGRGERFGDDKLFVPLHGKPLLQWTLEAILGTPAIGRIALVLREENLRRGAELVERLDGAGRTAVTSGGDRRRDSVAAGLGLLPACDWIVIHDGARPLVTPSLIEAGLRAAVRTGAATAAVPVRDTIKQVDASGIVVSTPDRAALWAAQTPQVFHARVLHQAHATIADDLTDDAALVERLGHVVVIFPGLSANLKVTTPDDLPIAAALLAARDGAVPCGR